MTSRTSSTIAAASAGLLTNGYKKKRDRHETCIFPVQQHSRSKKDVAAEAVPANTSRGLVSMVGRILLRREAVVLDSEEEVVAAAAAAATAAVVDSAA